MLMLWEIKLAEFPADAVGIQVFPADAVEIRVKYCYVLHMLDDTVFPADAMGIQVFPAHAMGIQVKYCHVLHMFLLLLQETLLLLKSCS